MKHVEAWTSELIAVTLENESLQDGSLSRSVRDLRQRNGKVTQQCDLSGSWLVALNRQSGAEIAGSSRSRLRTGLGPAYSYAVTLRDVPMRGNAK